MKDCNGRTIHEGEIVCIPNHPDFLYKESWVVVDFLGCTKDFILQHFITHEIKVFSQKDVSATY
jgi:hypothetical protein